MTQKLSPEETILAAIPETGEIAYDDLRAQVVAQDRHAIGSFHDMRRAGKFHTRVANRDGGGQQLFCSRVPYTQGVTDG
jgi:hypothetical protein